ncbi:MAG: hypothetical protein GQ565_03655 [Candidatus Aegiribacteria sp.]|nr:hypothetical protein [Candidatus Aegiribacteria sp.]
MTAVGFKNRNGSRRGVALVLVFVVTLVMSLLVAAVYILFSGNVASYEYVKDRIGARFAAEAGARVAVHELSLETELPVCTDPFHMPDDSSGWITMPGIEERALVVIDPRNVVSNPRAIRGVEIRTRGSMGSMTMDVSMRYAPDAPSRYALLVDEAIPAGFFTDGRKVEGPVHCNGVINFSSVSADSTGDPFAEEISTTSEEGGFRFADAGFSKVPHPAGSAVWVRPYLRHLTGSPVWTSSARSVDFARVSAYFNGLLSEASKMGTVVSGVKRIIIDGNTVYMKSADDGPVTRLDLEDGKNLVFILNGSMPVYIKSGQSMDIPLTIVATGSVYIYGNIRGPAAGSNGPLAIVSLGDFIIPSDPAFTGATDWYPPWDINTEANLSVSAFLAAPSGELRSENIVYPPIELYFCIHGGLMEKKMGRLGSGISGYYLAIEYDQGLKNVMPPYFPILENWIMTSWIEDPGYGGGSIDDDRY